MKYTRWITLEPNQIFYFPAAIKEYRKCHFSHSNFRHCFELPCLVLALFFHFHFYCFCIIYNTSFRLCLHIQFNINSSSSTFEFKIYILFPFLARMHMWKCQRIYIERNGKKIQTQSERTQHKSYHNSNHIRIKCLQTFWDGKRYCLKLHFHTREKHKFLIPPFEHNEKTEMQKNHKSIY